MTERTKVEQAEVIHAQVLSANPKPLKLALNLVRSCIAERAPLQILVPSLPRGILNLLFALTFRPGLSRTGSSSATRPLASARLRHVWRRL